MIAFCKVNRVKIVKFMIKRYMETQTRSQKGSENTILYS